MRCVIVILNWNGKSDTLECLASLDRLKKTNHQVETVVVDNASTDGSVAAIRSRFPNVTVISHDKNLGFAAGNNAGIRHAFDHGVDYIMLLNNDTTVDTQLLLALIVASKQHRDKAVIGAKIYFYPGREFHHDRYTKNQRGRVFWYAGGLIDWDNVLPTHRGVDEVDHGQYDRQESTEFISGCALFAHRRVFERLHLFDTDYFAYYEDVDFSVRARLAGMQLIYAPQAVVWHKNAGSSGGSGSPTHQYYMIRNQLLFGMKYARVRAKAALLRQSIIILVKGNTWERWGIIDYFLHRLGKTERGL